MFVVPRWCATKNNWGLLMSGDPKCMYKFILSGVVDIKFKVHLPGVGC